MPPPLMEENALAWKLWCFVQTQWRVGMSLVGLDYPAVLAVAKIYDIEVKQELFAKIQALERETLLLQHSKNKKK